MSSEGGIAPDTSWSRGGRSLREWLVDLLRGSEEERRVAVSVLDAMAWAKPWPAPRLDAIDLLACHRVMQTRSDEFRREAGQVLESIADASDVRTLVELHRSWRATFLDGFVATSRVIRSLGATALRAPDAVAALLRSDGQLAAELIADIGPGARELVPVLLERIGRSDAAARALGVVMRGDSGLCAAAAQRIDDREPEARCGAALALEEAGPWPGGDVVLERLLARIAEPGFVGAAASLGRDDAPTRARVLALAGDAHADTWLRPAALTALRHFREHAAECVPTLLRALDDFDEPDPDMAENGAAARVARVVRELGPGASDLVVPLAREMSGNELRPSAILKTFIALGPAASAAAPFLERCRDVDDEEDAEWGFDMAPWTTTLRAVLDRG